MATWNQIKSLIRSIPGITVIDELDSVVQVGYRFNDGRTHRAFISERVSSVGTHWIVISVIVVEFTPKRLEAVARSASGFFCGSVATFTFNGMTAIVLQEGVPTANLDPAELISPLSALIATADHIEEALTGGNDSF